jgi:hypothetical protein
MVWYDPLALMEHKFVKLVGEATARKWCSRPHCSTCGAHDFRSALAQACNQDPEELAQLLASLPLKELLSVQNWDGYVRIAYFELKSYGLQERVLTSWLSQAQASASFADFVLFRFIRYLPSRELIRRQWISGCLDLALRSRHSSLVESLLWTLQESANQHPRLVELARELEQNYPSLTKPLQRYCVALNEARPLKVLFGDCNNLLDSIVPDLLKRTEAAKHGIVVNTATNGTQVKAMAQAEAYDLFVLVLNNLPFPRLDPFPENRIDKALKLVSHLASRYDKPIIALAGWPDDPELKTRAERAGSSAFFKLPFDARSLIEVVADRLDLRV